VGIPLGDVLRAIVPSRWGFVRRLLALLKGSRVTVHGTEIDLSERPTIGSSTPFDAPHQPGPPPPGPRR